MPKMPAYSQFAKAIRHRVLTRPETCSKCGKVSRVHGHHEDYSKPLDVIWLCAVCHRNTHTVAKPPSINVNIRIPKSLHVELKTIAYAEGILMSEFISGSIIEAMKGE